MSKTKEQPWYSGGLHFECCQCGNCCSGPGEGYIWVTRQEIELIAGFLKIPVGELRRQCLKRVGFRTTVIEHRVTKDCIFLRATEEGKRCVIYPVRPNQCRTWPFWGSNLTSANAWNEAVKKCGGVNRGRYYSFEEIEEIRKSRWWLDERKEAATEEGG